jgi:glycosyltransferase involved in cell wall biosynthesis
MKILVVGNLYPPIVFGGYEILCAQVVERLRARGHEVEVLTSDFRAEDATLDMNVDRSLRLTTDFPRPGEEVGFVDFRLGSIQAVARWNFHVTLAKLRRADYDVVFCWCMNRLSLGPVYAARDRGVPVCCTVNDEHPRQFRWTPDPVGIRQHIRAVAERRLWPMATFRGLESVSIAVISHALKRTLIAQGVPLHEAEVIHQGIPLDGFPFRPLERHGEDPLRLLYVGQLAKTKGVHTLIRSIGELRGEDGRDVRLTVVGSGVPKYRASLEKMVLDHGIGDRVSFMGKVGHDEVARAYRTHHAFVFPSEWEEPFGLTHLEAMASGCPVISTTTGGSAELIRHNENAMSFPAGDSSELSARIRRLSDSEALRRRLARNGRAWVEKHHSLEGYVSGLESFLRREVDRRGLSDHQRAG